MNFYTVGKIQKSVFTVYTLYYMHSKASKQKTHLINAQMYFIPIDWHALKFHAGCACMGVGQDFINHTR